MDNQKSTATHSLPPELAQNPLLAVGSQLFPDFQKISPEDFAPALDYVLQQARYDIDQIIAENIINLENTIFPLERAFNEINKVTHVFYHLHSCNTSDSLDALAEHYAPILTEFYSFVYQNSQLFTRIETLLSPSHTEELDPATYKLLSELRKDFIQFGASLNKADKQTLQNTWVLGVVAIWLVRSMLWWRSVGILLWSVRLFFVAWIGVGLFVGCVWS